MVNSGYAAPVVPLSQRERNPVLTSTIPASRSGNRALVAVLLLAGLMLGPALVATPAHAATGSFCSGKGVSLVVDFGKLGGGVQEACVEHGAGKTADKLFEQAGHDLTPVGAFPGAVCRVDGQPKAVNCAKMPPANAYWGLYVKKGAGWDYAPKGANELVAKDGDFVGFAWQSSKKSTPPSVAPVAAPASSSKSPSATHKSATRADTSSGLSWWIPALVAVLILAAAVGVAVARRRH